MRLPEFIRHWLLGHARRITCERSPDSIIPCAEGDYLLRWYILPPNRFLSVYVHLILASDDDRAMHDHRSATLSLILEGGYDELVPTNGDPFWPKLHIRQPGDVVFRLPGDLHRLQVPKNGYALTLFVTGPTVREWGFRTPVGWVRHEEYFQIFGQR